MKKPLRFEYPSGFKVGDRVRYNGRRSRYNPHIVLVQGQTGIIDEPTDAEGWPEDAVQVVMDEHDGACRGFGALSADCLERIEGVAQRSWNDGTEANQRVRDIMIAVAKVVEAWDTADEGCGNFDGFLAAGGVEPLRELLILHGNPLMPVPKSVVSVEGKKL